ncbi:MAG: hydroxyacylglutathione hydrolase [Dichotomicrobium sp.]
MLEVYQFICRSDNFGVLIHDPDAGVTAAIDAPDADAVRRALKTKGWNLTHILVTHHHADHTAGIGALKGETGCTVTGPAKGRISGVDTGLSEGDVYSFGNYKAQILETPGHTLDHIVYWFEDAGLLFAGDTLFSLGCGRVFEGTPAQMWTSLQKLKRLPPDTEVYCGHEYTLANAEFALTVESGNDALQTRAQEVRRLRDEGQPTLPTTLGRELETNPFLRPDSPEIRATLGMPDDSDEAVWTELRKRKDRH